MTVTIDAAGRLVLPKSVRERAGLASGVPIEVRVVDGRVELEPACARVRVERRGGFWIAVPAAAAPVLTQEEVAETVDEVRAPARAGGGS
jgi:AbrB family looped-hinge helix DNA binding protein